MSYLKTEIKTMPQYYNKYIDQVLENDFFEAISASLHDLEQLPLDVLVEKAQFAYAPAKWTVAEMFQHIIDAERIFQFRALSFARGEQAHLNGFEEDDYARNSNANERSFLAIFEELKTVRLSTLHLFQSFNIHQLNQQGIASNTSICVRAIGFAILGHQKHHLKVLNERYLG